MIHTILNKKIFLYHITIFLFVLSVPVLAQFDNTITISKKEFTLPALLKEISEQSQLRYSVNAKEVDHKKIKLIPGRYSLRFVLNEIKKQTCLTSSIIGDHIIFVKKLPPGEKKECPQKQIARQKKIPPPAVKDSLQEDAWKEKERDPIIKDTVAASRKDPLVDSIAIPNQQPVSTIKTPIADTIPIKKSGPEKSAGKLQKDVYTQNRQHFFQPFIKTGFAAEELFYANGVVKAGIPIIHGVVYAGTTFSSSWLRYGLGSSFPLSPSSSIFIEATMAQQKKSFTAFDDSLEPYEIPVKQKLLQVGAGWERIIHRNWSITVRAHYAQLTTTETSAHFSEGVNSKWYIIEPPYTIHRRNTTNQSVDGWLGVQLALLYRLPFH